MTEQHKLAQKLVSSGPVKTEATPKRVRGLFRGRFLFDTIAAVYVWEHEYYPYFYIPAREIAGLQMTGDEIKGEHGTAILASLKIEGSSLNSLISFESGPLKGLVRIDFPSIESWYIEDEQIYQHPKDPYKRVDCIPSSREVKVLIGGVEIAKSNQNVFLFETLLPTRYYLSATSVKWEYLSPSETTSLCPYKGQANYYNVTINGIEHKDAIWWYRYPTAESALVAGRLCFYNEKVDIYIDGVLQERPKTKFS